MSPSPAIALITPEELVAPDLVDHVDRRAISSAPTQSAPPHRYMLTAIIVEMGVDRSAMNALPVRELIVNPR